MENYSFIEIVITHMGENCIHLSNIMEIIHLWNIHLNEISRLFVYGILSKIKQGIIGGYTERR